MPPTSAAPRTFPGDPNPPAEAPEERKAPQTSTGPSTSAGTGALPPASQGGDGGDEQQVSQREASDRQFFALERKDGTREVFMQQGDEAPVRMGQVSVDDADHVLHETSHYDEDLKRWDGLSQQQAQHLGSGRLPLVPYLEAKWGEGNSLRGLIGLKFLTGDFSDQEAKERGNVELLKDQLKEAPIFAWQGGFGPTVAKMWADFKQAGVGGVARRAAGEVAAAAPDLLRMGGEAATDAGVLGGAGAAVGFATAGPPGALIGLEAGAHVGAAYGVFKHVFDVSSGNTALDLLDKGFDPKTVKVVAPLAGALNGLLMDAKVDVMTKSMQKTALGKLVASDTLKGVLARYVSATAQGVGLSAAQKAVDVATQDIAARIDQRPDLAEKAPISSIINAAVTSAPVMAAMAVPGAALEAVNLRANTAEEARAQDEMTKTLDARAQEEAAAKAPEKPLATDTATRTLAPMSEEDRQALAKGAPAPTAEAPGQAPSSPEERVKSTIEQYQRGEISPEQLLDETSKVLGEKDDTPKGRASAKVEDTALKTRVDELQSNLADTRRTINDLAKVRDNYVKTGVPTRSIDAQLRGLLKEEAQLKQDYAYYTSPDAEAPTAREKLAATPATLEDVMEAGFKEGGKQSQTRAKELLKIAQENGLTAPDVKKLVGNAAPGAMSDVQYHNFLEGFDRRKVDEKSGDVSLEHQEGFREKVAALVEKKRARVELASVIKEKGLEKQQYVRQLHELPPIHKMTTEQLRDYADILRQYDKGDEALAPARIKALQGSELEGVKTQGDVRKRFAQIVGEPVKTLQDDARLPLRAAAVPDPQLRRWHPALKPLVDLSAKMTERGKMMAETVKGKLNTLAAEALAERHAQMGVGERIKDFFAPQQREVMAYIENPSQATAAKLTPKELEWADTWRSFAAFAEDHLVKRGAIEEATRFSGKYAPHAPRDFFEIVRDLKEVGLKRSAAELFLPRLDEAEFSSTKNVLGFNKLLKQALFRTGELVPSKNMARVMSSYVDDFYNKVTQDQISPVLDTLARSLRPEQDGLDPREGKALTSAVEEFTKAYANNKKGINNAGGMVDALTAPAQRLARTMAAIHYIQGYYALQATVAAVKMVPGEFMALGTDLFKAKALKYTEPGKAILERYGKSFAGEGALDTLRAPGAGLREAMGALGSGIFQFAHKTAMEDVLLGSLTKEELKSGEVSPQRLAEIKLSAGRWLDIEGHNSIIGNTETGKSFKQFKSWAVPPIMTLAEDAQALSKRVTQGEPLKPEHWQDLRRLAVLASFAATAGTVLHKDQEDDSFVGQMIHYVRNDIHSMWAGLDPKFFFTTPVGAAYVFKLAQDLSMLGHLESYKTKDGLKGADALKRDATPRFVKQFQSKKGKGE